MPSPQPSRRRRAAGNRPILLMGHRDTVFPKGEPARRPFKIEGDRAYGPGVADMKAGLVMNCFVLAAIKTIRRCAGAGHGAVYRRRGDRLAVLAQGDRAARSVRSRGVQLRARPRSRRGGHRPQGRRVHALRDHRQGRPFRRELRAGHQRDQRTRAQDAGAACPGRPAEWHHAQCRGGVRGADRQHRRAVGARRG